MFGGLKTGPPRLIASGHAKLEGMCCRSQGDSSVPPPPHHSGRKVVVVIAVDSVHYWSQVAT